MSEQPPVVVVGSGPAGAAACTTLASAGIKTLLLEAGKERRGRGLIARVRGITVAKVRRRLRLRPGVTMTGDPRTELYEDLAPGGLSNHWSCAVPRFAPEDFADAERAGEAYSWPIGYADLAPFYDRVEPLLHIAGSAEGSAQLPAGNVRKAVHAAASWKALASAAVQKGRTLSPMPYAYGADNTLTFSGNAFNSFVRVVKPALATGHVKVAFDSRVIRLDFSPGTRRVTGVFVRHGQSGIEERIPCRAVVLAAGAVTSAQILLESKSADFPEGLGNTHGVLGRYLHDHPLGKLVLELGKPIGVYPPVYLTRPNLERSEPLYAAACMQWSGPKPLAQSVLRGHPATLEQIGFSVFGTMAPSTDDWVGLDPTRARVGGASALTLNVRHPPAATRALEQARDELVELLQEGGYQPRVSVWHVEPVGNSNHYGGSCRMHASPRFGMLDGFSRLHAVSNVVVADSGAFTTGPEKNPVLTAMALSARASDRLANEIKSGDF